MNRFKLEVATNAELGVLKTKLAGYINGMLDQLKNNKNCNLSD